MRKFASGATRDTEGGKLDYEGFFSPLVIQEFGRYMHRHRRQANGNLRASDNWQRGIPLNAYMSSLWRHFLDIWALHRGLHVFRVRDDHGETTHLLELPPENLPEGWTEVSLKEALCALMFNAMGYLFEILRAHHLHSGGRLEV